MFQTSPDFKGIKTCLSTASCNSFGFKPALISKGLRPEYGSNIFGERCFKPALISKGLRRAGVGRFASTLAFQTSPDFKGIKTHPVLLYRQNGKVSNQP